MIDIIRKTSNTAKVVLYAEDDPQEVFILQHALRKLTCTATFYHVANGAEAIQWLAGENEFADRVAYPVPDVLVTDLNMPQRNGLEVLLWVRAQPAYKNLPVIIHSTSDSDADAATARRFGVTEYVVKKTSPRELVQRIGCILKCPLRGTRNHCLIPELVAREGGKLALLPAK